MSACPFARRIRFGSILRSLNPEPLHSERALARTHMWKSRAICLATIFALGVKLRARQNSEKTTHVSSPLSSWTCRLRPQLPTRPVEKQGHRPHSLTSPTSTRLAGRRSVEATHRARGGAGPETPRTREGADNPTRAYAISFYTQNCDQRGQPMRGGRPRDLTQVRICKKTTTITIEAAEKKNAAHPPIPATHRHIYSSATI